MSVKEALRDWKTEAMEMVQYTPDCNALFKKRFWLLFNYNLFHHIDGTAIGFTDHKFCVWKQDIGTLLSSLVALETEPGDVDSSSLPPWADPVNAGSYKSAAAARLRGILQLIPTYRYLEIDTEMENGIMFIRKRVSILVPQHTLFTAVGKLTGKTYVSRSDMTVRPVEAWMYVGSPKYFNSDGTSVDAGYLFKPAKLSRPKSFWIGDFYTV